MTTFADVATKIKRETGEAYLKQFCGLIKDLDGVSDFAYEVRGGDDKYDITNFQNVVIKFRYQSEYVVFGAMSVTGHSLSFSMYHDPNNEMKFGGYVKRDDPSYDSTRLNTESLARGLKDGVKSLVKQLSQAA